MAIFSNYSSVSESECSGLSYTFSSPLTLSSVLEESLQKGLEELRKQQAAAPLNDEQYAERIAAIFADTFNPIPSSKYQRIYPTIEMYDTRFSIDFNKYFKIDDP